MTRGDGVYYSFETAVEAEVERSMSEVHSIIEDDDSDSPRMFNLEGIERDIIRPSVAAQYCKADDDPAFVAAFHARKTNQEAFNREVDRLLQQHGLLSLVEAIMEGLGEYFTTDLEEAGFKSDEVHPRQPSEGDYEWSLSDFAKYGIKAEIGAEFDTPSGRHQVTAIFHGSGQKPTGIKSRRIIPRPDEDLEELAPREADSEESDLGSTEAKKDFTNSKDPIQLIQELGKLRDAGLLTEEEFQAKKRDLLNGCRRPERGVELPAYSDASPRTLLRPVEERRSEDAVAVVAVSAMSCVDAGRAMKDAPPVADDYPLWKYYPSRARPPDWVAPIIAAFAASRGELDTASVRSTSDAALAVLRPALVALGFEVEAGKKKTEKIRRPVLFGEQGKESQAYEVDGFQPVDGLALEIEAGRGARGNAVYRDLIEASLLVDARFLVLAVQAAYRHKSGGRDVTVQSYRDTQDLLDAIYASNRLQLPLEGILLVGY